MVEQMRLTSINVSVWRAAGAFRFPPPREYDIFAIQRLLFANILRLLLCADRIYTISEDAHGAYRR